MKIRYLSIIVALLLVQGADAVATEPHSLALGEVLRLAKKVDHEISAAQMHEAAVESNISIARSGYLPTVDLDAIYSTGFPGSSGWLGIGGLVGSPYRSGPAFGLVAKETLWDFGRTSNAVEVAKHEAQASKNSTRVISYQVDQDASRLYFECVKYRSQSDTWGFVLEQAQLISREVKRFVSTGQRSIVEKYLAESQVEEALTAQADFQEHAQLVLKRLGLVIDIDIQQMTCPNIESLKTPEVQETPDQGLHPLITLAQEQAQAARARADAAKAGYLPELVGVASVGEMENSRLVAKQDYAVGVGLVIPLFDGLKTTSEVAHARAIAAEKEFLVQAGRDRVAQANAKFDELLNTSKGRMAHLDRELQLSKEGFGLARKRYLSFQGTLIDVRESLRNLTRTETQLTDSKTEFLEAITAKALFNGYAPGGAGSTE